MESTGVYWIAPHEVLERTGLEVVLVGTRQLARVPGRKKTDRVDCRWDSAIAQLRAAARLVPAGRTGVHATDPGAGQSHSGGGDWRLATADAEEPGSDECTRAPGGIGYRWGGPGWPSCGPSWGESGAPGSWRSCGVGGGTRERKSR